VGWKRALASVGQELYYELQQKLAENIRRMSLKQVPRGLTVVLEAGYNGQHGGLKTTGEAPRGGT